MIPFLDLKSINASFEPALSEAVRRVVESGSFIRDVEVRTFEEAYAAFIGTRYCVGTGNGFDAIQLILRAWCALGELREGDEVIVPANTYIASILAVSAAGLIPVPVEPDPETLNIDPRRIAENVGSRTRVILAVHLYGRNAADENLLEVARQHGLKVLEDNAQAAGCTGLSRRTGAIGDAAAHSFFPTKNIGALGDGGAVTTDDSRLAEMVRTLGNYGSADRGRNDVKGINSRLDELQAAVLGVKLLRLDEDNDKRRRVARLYLELLSDADVLLPSEPNDRQAHVWHLFVIRTSRRDQLRAALRQAGIETLVHYPVPPHQQLAYREWNERKLPITEELHRSVVSLPLHPLMTREEATTIAQAVRRFSYLL